MTNIANIVAYNAKYLHQQQNVINTMNMYFALDRETHECAVLPEHEKPVFYSK